MTWSLYENGKFLEPLKFSNSKSQEDVVKETLNAVKEGHKIIFIHGVCGTGKSAIALNIAKKLGKSSIIVPNKNLQNQYKRDYEKTKYLLKNNGEKLKISVITGRNNHKCRFLEENKKYFTKKETDSKLTDIFKWKNKKTEDFSADDIYIPCKIEIREKNWNRIKEYLKQNKKIRTEDFSEIKDVKRVSVATVCPYWSPVLPEKYTLKILENSKKKSYTGLDNIQFVFHKRKDGCKFYEQFDSFVESDVIVFNSLKYKLESILKRKPLTEIEIIDECDEFLDSFSNHREINLDKIQNSLSYVYAFGDKIEEIIDEVNAIIKYIKNNKRITNAVESREIIPLRETGIYDLLKIFLDSPEFLYEIDEESYLFEIEKIAKEFEDFFEDSYLTFFKEDKNLVAKIVTINLAKKFREISDKNKIIVLMSGTLHSEKVLKDIFGLKNFKIVEAEIQHPGKIEIKKTGLEMDCKHANFANGKLKREKYLKALDKCIEIAKKPTLVHVIAFYDLPSEEEIKSMGIKNLLSREELIENQKNDKSGNLIEEFKKGKIEVLFSTQCSRGMDFPGKECNSIIFTKYPYPNIEETFWKILRKVKPQDYWEFYKDKARRELWQKVYRGLRFKEDHVYVLSPDERVLNTLKEI